MCDSLVALFQRHYGQKIFICNEEEIDAEKDVGDETNDLLLKARQIRSYSLLSWPYIVLYLSEQERFISIEAKLNRHTGIFSTHTIGMINITFHHNRVSSPESYLEDARIRLWFHSLKNINFECSVATIPGQSHYNIYNGVTMEAIEHFLRVFKEDNISKLIMDVALLKNDIEHFLKPFEGTEQYFNDEYLK